MTSGDMGRDDRAHWRERYRERGPELDRAPSDWVVDRCRALPADALVLDLAGGSGRNAAAIARTGRSVIVMDFIFDAVRSATARGDRIAGLVADARSCPLRHGSLDAIVCVSFLDRSIFPVLATLLARGGVLLYETFTRHHLDVVARGRARGPRSPDYLLEPGELRTLVAPLDISEYDELLISDPAGDRHVARVVATRR